MEDRKVLILFLTNGDKIIGSKDDSASDTSDVLTLNEPMQLQFIVTEEGRLSPVLLPYLPYKEENSCNIYKQNLLIEPYEPEDMFKRTYNDQITRMKAARSNIVMANMVPPNPVSKMGNVVKL